MVTSLNISTFTLHYVSMIIDVNLSFNCDLDFAYFIYFFMFVVPLFVCLFVFFADMLNQFNLQLFLTNFKMTRNFEFCDVIFA